MKQILTVGRPSDYKNNFISALTHLNFEVDTVYEPIQVFEKFINNPKQYKLLIIRSSLSHSTAFRLLNQIKVVDPDIRSIVITDSIIERRNPDIDAIFSESTPFAKIIQKIYSLNLDLNPKNRTSQIAFGADNITVALAANEVYQNQEAIKLTHTEYLLIRHFLTHKRQLVSREKLLEVAWGDEGVDANPRIIDIHIKNLRKKINVPALQTYRGEGYRWEE